ncbi:MAG TPA: hypothetical protein VGO60_00615 [Iamia sp.]|jgi:hypothetical protein|nr:hypothetical protein [Iamia sp.]
MRSPEMEALDVLVGEWRTTLANAWFDVPPGADRMTTTVSWIGEAFVLVEWESPGGGNTFCLGRSGANDAYWALYHDGRGTDRLFAMTFAAGDWTLIREDPDFHQRFIATVEPDRIAGRWEASEDAGATWRKDFDLTFERA